MSAPALSLSADDLAAGRRLFSAPARFRLGVARLEQLPPLAGVEIAFAGRSNAGKSSLINALTGVRDLARASNTPGRTRELNFFDLGEGRMTLVDMPGYGFAKAPKADVKKWQALLRAYLRGRPGLARVFVLVDSRHGLMTADLEMLAMLDEAAVTYQIALTKADKVKPAELVEVHARVSAAIARRPAAYPVVLATSAEKQQGLDEMRAVIAGLLAA
ncbi:MAG TPA: ribosome biogenesis GTP-binding protein YihA/YsxC [Aestuariivirga sp.]|mgnify:FL=1|nr:ribosome biogenesis GTP-binding protein YihA/YsxC [Aestuariivirga sp.]